MAKVYSGYFYKVPKYKDTSELNINRTDNFDDVVEEINRSCERAAKLGYHNDEKWLIVLVEYQSVYDDDGVFCSSWRNETAIALYDNGTVTEF